MYNLETLSTIGTRDTGRKQTIHKNPTHHRKLKRWATRSLPQTGDETRYSQRESSSCLLYVTWHVTRMFNTCWTPLYENTHKYKQDM